MMTHKLIFQRIYRISAALLIAGFVAACGGGSGGGSDDSGTASQVSTGTITGFGSVFVNGQRFGTDSATVVSDGSVLGNVNQLKVGMRVTVSSDSSSLEASRVRHEEDIKGPIDTTVNDFSAPISVMGQTVIIDAGTVVDNSLSFPLNAGDILEISGMRQANDSLLATFIEDKLPSEVDKYEVIGHARSVDTVARTFTIDGLTVNYGGADVSDLPGGHPVDGQLVEVKDENEAYVAGSFNLVATKVEPFDMFDGNGNNGAANIEIETVVTGVSNPGQVFEIPGFTVNILPGTVFLFGDATEIGVGTVLQVRGVRNGTTIDANRIRFKRNSARIEGTVDPGGVSVGNNQLTMVGITVQLTPATEMEDDRDGVSPFTINQIASGDFLEIRGYISASGALIATELERDDFDTEVKIRGTASNIAGQSLRVLGIDVTAGPGTIFNDGLDNAATFFGSLNEGLSVVSVDWDPFISVNVAPKEMELEDNFASGTP